jgi:hypothetical protein
MREDSIVTALHRVEALPGDGRYALTFRRDDSSEQSAVVHVTGDGVSVAAASLPRGWSTDSKPFRAVADALLALERARALSGTRAALRDVPGGWDVMLGNVVLQDGRPACTAHGRLDRSDDPAATTAEFACPECGARALFE